MTFIKGRKKRLSVETHLKTRSRKKERDPQAHTKSYCPPFSTLKGEWHLGRGRAFPQLRSTDSIEGYKRNLRGFIYHLFMERDLKERKAENQGRGGNSHLQIQDTPKREYYRGN